MSAIEIILALIAGCLCAVSVVITIPRNWRILRTWDAEFDDKALAGFFIIVSLFATFFMAVVTWEGARGFPPFALTVLFFVLATWRELRIGGAYVRDYLAGENHDEWKERLEQWRKTDEPPRDPIALPTVPSSSPSLVAKQKHDALPDSLRTEHTVIVAQSGHGKTQLFQSLILDDIEKDATVIVIDSQSQLINNLLNVVPVNRLAYYSPTDKDHPLALNLFAGAHDADLYEYIFSALDAGMTGKQSMLYRYLSRLIAVIPGGTIDTMRQLLEKGGLEPYRQHLEKLPPLVRSFFEKEFVTSEYTETKQQLARRLYSLMENETFASMFTAPDLKVDIMREMNAGNVILIDASKRILRGDSFKIFGRFFIAQIAKAIFSREHPYQKRVYIYIDEFQEYAGEEGFITDLFTQARKFNVALTVAFQFLGQVPDEVEKAILSNTAIKMVGSVSASDRRALANEMGVPPEVIQGVQKGQFVTYLKGYQTRLFTVSMGRLEALGTRSKKELDTIRAKMRQKYGRSPEKVVDPEPPKRTFEDFEDRS